MNMTMYPARPTAASKARAVRARQDRAVRRLVAVLSILALTFGLGLGVGLGVGYGTGYKAAKAEKVTKTVAKAVTKARKGR